jgi:membrane protease YdiL (CAAX protease family)
VSVRKRLGVWVLVAGCMASVLLGHATQLLADPVLVLALGAASVEGMLMALAVGIALLLPGAPRLRLGLVASRLGPAQIVGFAAGTLGLSHALDSALVWSGLYHESELSNFAASLEGARGFPLLAAALAIGVLAPLAEELLCRGLIQRSLAARVGAPAALGLSAAAFGALHVEPVHAAAAALLGLYLGAAGWAAGNVWVPVACHVVNNLFAVGVAAWSGPNEGVDAPVHVAGGMALAAASLAFVWRSLQRTLQPAPGSVDG